MTTTPQIVTAEAVARCRRDGGPLDEVRFYGSAGQIVSELLPPYDALRLAKDIRRNRLNGGEVALITAGGGTFTGDEVLALRF